MSKEKANGFYQSVYRVVAQIPRGCVASYGQIAHMAGYPGRARMVGWAMHQAPAGLPCHRVVRKDGMLSSPDLFGGEGVWRQMLEAEDVSFDESGKIRMERHCWLSI